MEAEAPWDLMTKTGKPKKKNAKRSEPETSVPLDFFDEESEAVANVTTNHGWERLELTVDSGAAETICPAKEVTGIPTQPGEKFAQGVRYTCAGGKKLPNLGEKRMLMVTADSKVQHNMTMQVAEVNRALMSVSRCVDAGNRVVFDDKWSFIEDKKTGHRSTIHRRGNLYVLESWVKARGDAQAPAQPFGRQGGKR